MTRIYLVRHAEAEGNLYRRAQGQYDSLITPRGDRQIESLRRRFEQTAIDAVYSSDLYRAVKTASAVSEPKGLPLHRDPRLREVRMGVWEDLSWGEIEWLWPEELEAFSNDPLRWRAEGSEHFLDLRRRLTDAIGDIAARNEGKTVAVFSHGCAIRAYLSGLVNGPEGGIVNVPHGDNTNVSLIEYTDGVPKLVFHGDNSHLDAELSTFAGQKWWREQTALDSSNMRFSSEMEDMANFLRYRLRAVPDAELKFGADRDPELSVTAYARETPAGCVELSPGGEITAIYIEERFRGTGMAVQLIGEAVSRMRLRGAGRLFARIPCDNARALGFFEKYGFKSKGVSGDRVTLTRDIAVPERQDA